MPRTRFVWFFIFGLPNDRRSPAAAQFPRGRRCSALLGRPGDFADSQPFDTSEFAEIAVESAEGQVTRFPSNLQNQTV